MEKSKEILSRSGEDERVKDVEKPAGDEGKNAKTAEEIQGEESITSGIVAKEDTEVNLKIDSAGESAAKNDKNETEDEKRDEAVDSSSSGSNGSTGVLKTDNSSLSNLLVYSSESSDSSDSESSSGESESYESPEVSDNDQESEGTKAETKKKGVQDTIRTFGELSLDDLPPVPDVSTLNVEVPEHECVHIGNVSGIIDRLVTVESLPNTPAYDLETLLFLDNGKKPLGYVYDVMGPVSNPIYVIRFNTKEEMDSVGVTKGLPVYSAPKTPHTQYVFLKQLMQVKGSDASWMGDNEVPPEHVEYSDDEEERRVRRGGSKKSADTRKRNSLERHKDFEKDMNVKNIIDTRLHKIRDSFEPSTKRHASNNNDKRGFPFQPSPGAPVFTFGQPSLTHPNVPSFNPFLTPPLLPPPFGPLPYIPAPHSMPPLPRMPPNVPFMPSIPPPQLPHHHHHHHHQAMTTQPMPPPPMPTLHHSIAVAPPMDLVQQQQQQQQQQQKHPQQMPPRMLYAPDMTLARPPRSAFVPLYNPRIPNMWTYQNRPQPVRPAQTFCQPRPIYYPKK